MYTYIESDAVFRVLQHFAECLLHLHLQTHVAVHCVHYKSQYIEKRTIVGA